MKKRKIYDKISLQEVLTDFKYRTIDNRGRVLPPSHQIYKEIAHYMSEKGSAITPKHVHTIVNNNRNGLRDKIIQTFNIHESEPTMTSTIIMDNIVNTSGSSTFTDTSVNFSANKSMKLNLVLSAEKWHSIRPMEKTYCNRVYYKLRPGWADVIAEALWVQYNIDCVFISKNNSVHHRSTAKAFMTFFGACKECGARIAGRLPKEPAKDVDVVLTCQIKDIETSVHTGNKRRPLRGLRRAAVADDIVEKSKDAVVWRRKEAARIKKFGGKDPPILPSNEVVRKAKEQRLLEKYGLNFADSTLNLLKSSEHGKFMGSIHHLALLKFACIYWRPEQMQIYVSRCRGDAVLCIDATGGLVKREKENDPHIFLYQCVLVTSEGSVPTFQMVSSDHRSLNVAHFLRLILAANAPIPPIVVTDFGWALLIAVAEIFGKCHSFADYLQRCYNVLVSQSTQHTLPATYMRLDVCHLAAMVSRWKCLTGNGLVRRFYKKCIGKASVISNLDELTYFLESVLVVALSNTIGQSAAKKPLPSEDRVRYLNDLIKGILDKESDLDNYEIHTEENALEENPEKGNEANDKTKMNWKSWSQNIFLRAQELSLQSADGDTINGCHNEAFATMLMKHLMPYVAIWTNIMLPIFGRGSATPTSAAVEAEFCDIKHREFKGNLPMRVDRFVLSHIESLDRKITLRSLEKDVDVCQDIEEAPSFESSSQNLWTVKEEWGGINKNQKMDLVDIEHPPPEKIAKKKAMGNVFYDDCPEWDYIKGSKSAYLPVMMNGSLGGPVRLNDGYLNLTDTCAFDSILAILISGMTRSIMYRDKLAESQCKIIILARDVWIKKKILKDHYKARAEILQENFIFKNAITKFTRSIKRLVATCNAGHLAQTLLEFEPSSTVKVSCPCGYTNERKYSLLNINVDIVLENGLHFMQQAVDDCLSESLICYQCDNEATVQNEYGPHLIIDLAIVTDTSYTKKENITHTLSSVKKTVCLGNNHYVLSGVVDYKEQKSHYVAYALTGEIWYVYDDLIKKRMTANQNAKIQPHVIIYTIYKIE